jgi:hypothetical protein
VDLPSGRPDGPARGICMSYVLIYAPELYPDQAKRWYDLYVRHFWQDNWLASGFREYPKDIPGKNWLMDPDSGPVMFGFSPSGNAYGVAAARLNGRFDHAWTLGAQALVAGWPTPDGSWFGARVLSSVSRGHAPYLGEANLLFLFTRRPADGVPITTGGHLPLLVWIGLTLSLGGGLLLAALAAKRARTWLRRVNDIQVPRERLQMTLWAGLLMATAWAALNHQLKAAVVLVLLAQFLPRYRSARPGIETRPDPGRPGKL